VHQAWPRDCRLPRPGDVVVAYSPPIMPHEYAGLTADALMELIRNRLIAMQQSWHRRVPHRRLEWYEPEPQEP